MRCALQLDYLLLLLLLGLRRCGEWCRNRTVRCKLAADASKLRHITVNSFSTRLLSSCTDEYAHTYDIHLLSKQWSCELGLGLGFSLRAAHVHTHHIHSRNMQTPCRKRVNLILQPVAEYEVESGFGNFWNPWTRLFNDRDAVLSIIPNAKIFLVFLAY